MAEDYCGKDGGDDAGKPVWRSKVACWLIVWVVILLGQSVWFGQNKGHHLVSYDA